MQRVEIPIDKGILKGDLSLPDGAKGIIVFAHGSGSSRLSPRNQKVAHLFQKQNFGTLLFDLLTEKEEQNEVGGEYRFNIELLTQRLVAAIRFLETQKLLLPIGIFGASTGAAAALKASLETDVFAIVSRGGRPDLAMDALSLVQKPTLLIVGDNDLPVIEMNEQAQAKMKCPVKLSLVEGATHLFEEEGKLEQVAHLAENWFSKHLPNSKEDLLLILRNKQTPMSSFRKAATTLTKLLANKIIAPKDVVLVPVLRSGLAMLPPFLETFPEASVGFLGMVRDEKTLLAHMYYQKLPFCEKGKTILLLDPMLATGGSAKLAIHHLIDAGASEEKIQLISIIGAKQGVQAVKQAYPRLTLHLAAFDETLDAHGFIVPGLGDFGDRFFGTYTKRNK